MRDYAPPGTRLLLYTVSGLVTSLIVAFSGLFADRWGRRRFLVAGTLIPVPSYLVFATTTDPAWLIAASVLVGVGLANGAAGALIRHIRDYLEHWNEHPTPFVWTKEPDAEGTLSGFGEMEAPPAMSRPLEQRAAPP